MKNHGKRRVVACLSIAIGLLSYISNASAANVEEGFTSIFNGKDLSGWEGEPGYWSVEDGAITGKTTVKQPLDHATYLFWRGGKLADFELRATYRFQGSFGNSGINFRSQQLPKWDVKGYQADMETGPNYSGILYECNQRAIMTQRGQKVVIDENGKRKVTALPDAPDYQKLIKPNDWNEYTVIARGPEIVLKINGAVTSQVIDREIGKAAADGLITLQLHPGKPMKVQFKNIRIKVGAK
jgi:3-keto-disaccharide hydrolase